MTRKHFGRGRARGPYRRAPRWGAPICLLVLALAFVCQGQPGQVVSWGTSLGGQYEPEPGDEYMTISVGGYHSLALTAGGTLAAWGENAKGQCNVPAGDDFVAICAGLYHNLALRTDGTVVAWGDNSRGQCNVPPMTRFLAIAAGPWHSLGIRADGSLVAWGWNEHGQCHVPEGRDYAEISGGYYHSLALKADGSLVAWGGNGDGQCNVPSGQNFVHIAAGSMHSLALKADGTVVVWGRDDEGQGRAPAGNDFIAVAAGAFHNVALRADGHVVAWGQNENGQCDIPPTQEYAIIAAGGFRSLAIRDNRPPDARPARVKVPTAKPTKDKKEQKDASADCESPSAPNRIQAAQPVQTQVTKESPADITKPGPSRPDTPAAKPAPEAAKPIPEVTKQTPEAAKPAKPPATDPNAPLDLNDLVRQGLAADLYMDASGNAVPVYHFTSVTPPGAAPGPKRHFCTISEEEKYKLIDTQSKVWKYESIAFFAYPEGRQPPGARPVYRFWSQNHGYFFTMDEAQKQMIIDKLGQTWTFQGIAWYAPPLKAGKK
jgi:hypothetical protein